MCLIYVNIFIFCCRERNLDLTSLCSDYYKTAILVDAYSISVMPVGSTDQWVIPEHIKNRVVLPPVVRTQTGRPRLSRMRSVAEGGRTRRCNRCGGYGHTNQMCPNPNPLDGSSTIEPSTTVPETVRRKCGICKTIGHNRLTCPQRVTVQHEIPNATESTSGSSTD
jgi:hypothetical protein